MKVKIYNWLKIKWIKITVLLIAFLFGLTSVQAVFPAVVCASAQLTEGYEIFARSENLILYCNAKIGNIAVEDVRTGYIWKSVVGSEVYKLDRANEQWKNYMTSMLVVNYIDTKSKEESVVKLYSVSDAKKVTVEKTVAGLIAVLDFQTVGISITIEMQLEGDSLSIRIPAEGVQERAGNRITSVELMPFFGSADRNVDGYILSPDGCGAITKYKSTEQRPTKVDVMTWDIYGSENVSITDYRKVKGEKAYQAMLPVYGVKNERNAILAAIVEGEEDAKINVYPEGYVVNLNHAFFEFVYRHFYKMNLSNITMKGRNTALNPVSTRADKEIIHKDREVRIFFLADHEADYSGMANVYRDYMEKQGIIDGTISRGEDIPLGLDLFMGVREERMFFDKYIPMTTFGDAEKIVEELKASGVEQIDIMLKGWTKGGYGLYPVHWLPDRSLGGQKGLEAFSKYTDDNRMGLYLQNDFIQADIRNGGFSTRKDVVIQGSNQPVTDVTKKLFFLNPFSAVRKFFDFLKKIDGHTDTGIAFNGIGRTIYHDYNRENPAGRSDTTQKWKDMLQAAQDQQKYIAVEGGNQYVLQYASRLYEIPTKTSGYQGTDETVPFYQMVIHGMIPYTSEPGNLSYDLDLQKLKWVEFGCMPYFELTYRKSVELRNTEYNRLFTSYYRDWHRQAAEIYLEFNNRLKTVWGEKMISHEKLGEALYRVGYENGTKIYINYSGQESKYDGYTIGAMNYLVVDRGGRQQ